MTTSQTRRIEELMSEIAALSARLEAAREELLEERFRGVPRYPEGTVVLVPRMLFGKTRMWPALIRAVHLRYSSGHLRSGEGWENKIVSYSVSYELRDGSDFSGETVGARHSEVVLRPEA
jgi:hypothetical protein